MQTSDDNDDLPVYDFGWWPEVAGAVGVAALITFLISFATGIM
ncbi:MAG: hypothetical protein RID15_04415 [Marinovum algicola]|jgi:hypothetical protein|uniref:Uncharacterized protein n=1 Tax=Marinovum algicola TaxID=42444 RepID=A0A975W8C5_9RHOB|nr:MULTISPECIES: hypothetical protein [Marinovum]MDD9740775.1 hypothetical protein [Marinovum sp. SP66]SEJ07119.1 hypothetical protein SAMN04487940_103133 [Marinovum algicola]SLN19601.1 hypothetical protein MAA5396_00646 [Marinovum algicola]